VVVHKVAKVLAEKMGVFLQHRACEEDSKLEVVNAVIADIVKGIENGGPLDITHTRQKVIVIVTVVVMQMENADILSKNANHFLGGRNP
jgi:hypothetical protein